MTDNLLTDIEFEHFMRNPLLGKTPIVKPSRFVSTFYGTFQVVKRKISCKKCENCTRDDCGDCQNCRSKVRFGGDGSRKQKCSRRRCVQPFTYDELVT